MIFIKFLIFYASKHTRNYISNFKIKKNFINKNY